MDKNPILRRVLVEGVGGGAFGNKSISGHLLSFSSVIDDLSNHSFQSLDAAAKSFSKELSLHPKQIMNHGPIDTGFTGSAGVWHVARMPLRLPSLPFFDVVSGAA